MNRLSLSLFMLTLLTAHPLYGQIPLWWTGKQDRIGGGTGSPTANFRQTETLPGAYYPSPGNGNGISSNESNVFDLVFDVSALEGSSRSMFINRVAVQLGTITLRAPVLEGFTLTDQAGQIRGTQLITGVRVESGLHRIVQVGADSWALAANTQWHVADEAVLQLALPLTGAFGLTKTGGGLLAISGMQAFSGGITANEGILLLQNRAAQPAQGMTIVAPGATLALGIGGSGLYSISDLEALAENRLERVNRLPGSGIGFDTSDSAVVYSGSFSGDMSVVKLGVMSLTLTGDHSYSGTTDVLLGLLQVDGSIDPASTVTVHANASIGGSGNIDGNLHFRAGGRLVFDPQTTLQVGGTVTFVAPFGIDNIATMDGAAAVGNYRLIDGEVDASGLSNVGFANAARLSLSRFAYFQINDGLELVLIDDPNSPPGLTEVPGSVVYWRESPSNRFFGSNRIYTTSPSIALLANGDYLIAFNLFGSSLNPSAEESGTTLLYRSADKGVTWSELPSSPMMDMKRASLVVQGDDVYLYGYRAAPGEVIIRRSSDNGETWTAATQLTSGTRSGTPHNPVFWNNESGTERLWLAVGGRRLISARTPDLLSASAWSGEGSAAEVVEPGFGSGVSVDVYSEAQIVAAPHTGVVVMPKVEMSGVAAPYFSYTALLRREPDSNRELLPAGVNEWVALPGAEKKFAAGYDAVSGRFYVLSNPVMPAHEQGSGFTWQLIRNTAAILSSADLLHWDLERIFLYSPNVDYEAFQYLNFDIEGDDLLVVSRTAFDIGLRPLPPRGHDSNLITFHRIDNFRNIAPDHFLRVEAGMVTRWERTQHLPVPWGSFVLGSSFADTPLTAVADIAMGDDNEILLREVTGRVLRFDPSGNFLGIGSAAGHTFATELSAIAPPCRVERSWRGATGGSWEALANWVYWGRADTDTEIAVFGSAIDADASIELDRERVLKGLRFNNPNRYTIAGQGSLCLRSADHTATLEVIAGHHRIDVPVILDSDARIEARAAARLALRSGLQLNGHRVRVAGSGEFIIGTAFSLNGGTLELVGNSRIDFFDATEVILSGSLVWLPAAGYVFAGDDSFQLFQPGFSYSGAFDTILLPDPGEGYLWDTSNVLTTGELKLIAPATSAVIRSISYAAGALTLQVDGPSGYTYSIQASTNLIDWQTLQSLVPPSVPFIWSEPLGATAQPDPNRRFYRIFLQP